MPCDKKIRSYNHTLPYFPCSPNRRLLQITCSNKAGCYKVSKDRWRNECESIMENPKERENQWTPYFFFFFPWPCRMPCRILVPWSGIEPAPLQWKCWVLTTGLEGSPLNSLKVNAMVYDGLAKSPPFLQMSPVLIQAGFAFSNRLSCSFVNTQPRREDVEWLPEWNEGVLLLVCPQKVDA